MLRFAESLLDPTARPPEEPPTSRPVPGTGAAADLRAVSGSGLARFYWHFIRQEKWLAITLFICGGIIAVLDAAVPAFIGRVVSLVSTHTPATLLPDTWTQFAFMAAVLLLVCPGNFLGYAVLLNQVVNPGLTT